MRHLLKPWLIVVLFSSLLGLGAGCSRRPELTDAEKLRQIEEQYEKYREEFPEVQDTSVAELLPLLDNRPLVIVDVREESERQVSQIPGAVSSESFEKNRNDYRGHLVVTYCTIGARSGRFAAKLSREGFDVVNLRGSILAWAHAGQPVVNQQGPTNRVHVYGPTWDLLPDGFEAVW